MSLSERRLMALETIVRAIGLVVLSAAERREVGV
jgi:hypothetical protein